MLASCEVCSAPFQKKKSHQKFCSPKCYQVGWVHRNRALYNKRAREGGKRRRAEARKPRSCSGCTLIFQPVHQLQVFCTPACQASFYTRTNRDSVNIWRNKWVSKTRQEAPWNILLQPVKSRARQQNLPYDLTKEWLEKRWKGVCELSGLPFAMEIGNGVSPYSPSIDKIVPAFGYVQNNCRVVLWAINTFKGKWDDDTMFKIARAMVSHSSKNVRGAPDASIV